MNPNGLVSNVKVGSISIDKNIKPGGRIQVADILVQKPLPANAKQKTELWSAPHKKDKYIKASRSKLTKLTPDFHRRQFG